MQSLTKNGEKKNQSAIYRTKCIDNAIQVMDILFSTFSNQFPKN